MKTTDAFIMPVDTCQPQAARVLVGSGSQQVAKQLVEQQPEC